MLQLGHAFIDSGRWRSGYIRLRFLDQWLDDDDSLPSPAQRGFQEQGRQYITRAGTAWLTSHTELVTPDLVPIESVSMRQDDIWLETQQYLALLLREKPSGESIERLSRASDAIDQELSWYITPSKRQHYQGIVSHDLAAAQLQAKWPVSAILENLDRAVHDLSACGHIGMTALTWTTMARTHGLAAAREPHRASLHLDRMRAATDQALEMATGESSDPLRANIWFAVTESALDLGGTSDEDRNRIGAVAELAISLGLGYRARKLLDDPRFHPLVGDYLDDLARVAAG